MPRVSLSLLDWIERQHVNGAALADLAPDLPWPVDESVGQRVVWWPRGIPASRRVALLSSRLGRLSRLGVRWFATIRAICQELKRSGETLVAARDTALAELVERCSQLDRIPLIRFELARSTWSFERWLAHCMVPDVQWAQWHDLCWPAIVSPPTGQATGGRVPARDAIMVAASDRLVACRVRWGGNTFRLLERRLSDRAADSDPCVTLLVGQGFVGARVARHLAALGARCVEVDPGHDAPATAGPTATDDNPLRVPWIAPHQAPLTHYLIHCTRAADGPWPDQDRADYLDGLIQNVPGASHSALATLARIVQQRRLLSSSRAIRGGTRVVCFTAATLAQLQSLHTFRAHRRRWDFEPYGIGVARQWLAQQGGRPVLYGDETLWARLSAAERPFFQRRLCGRQTVIDWSIEREWRHVGDLDLGTLPAEAGFLFVPTPADALQLGTLSRWPIVILAG